MHEEAAQAVVRNRAAHRHCPPFGNVAHHAALRITLHCASRCTAHHAALRITLHCASSKPAANLTVWLVQLPFDSTTIGTSIQESLITRGWADPENYRSLKGFTFPFSGKQWDSFNVAIGAITFGTMQRGADPGRIGGPPPGNRTGAGGSTRNGFQMDRYASLQTVGEIFINMIPGIAAYIKSGLNGPHFVKELPDRAVVTWTLSEGAGGIQSFTWVPTVNRIQATLYKSGVIELSYNDVSARDGVVGVFPMITGGVEKALATIPARRRLSSIA